MTLCVRFAKYVWWPISSNVRHTGAIETPNNVSTVRIRDYEESRKWLNDASKLRIDPKIPRKLSDDCKEIMNWQLATFQTDYDPWKNPWLT